MSKNLSLCLFLSVCTSLQAHADSVEKHLRKNFEKKVVALRAGYDADNIHFDKDGNVVGAPAPRPWLNGGVLLVQKVNVKHDTVELEGERVVFMRKTEKPIATSKKVKIAIDLPPGATDDSVAKTLAAVFEGDMKTRLAGYSDLKTSRIVPNTPWDTNGDRLEFHGDPFHGWIPPKPLETPDPQYTEKARQKKIQGVVTLSLVIDKDGFPELFDVQKSIPELDVNAVEAVSRWRFKPAIKDGEPQAVQISVEVNFHLYR